MPTIVNAKTKNIRGVESSMPTLMDGEIGLPTDKARIWKGTSASGNQIVSDYDLTLQNSANIAKLSNKNYMINGNFDEWQRGITLLNPNGVKYIADRFAIVPNISGTSPANITHSKIQLINGEVPNATNGYRLSVDGSGILNSNDCYQIKQHIENGVRKLCGINKKLTLSFYAKSSIANKKLGIHAFQSYGSGGTPSAGEAITGKFFTLTSNWTKYSLTFNTITLNGKTFGTNNDDTLQIIFNYVYGSDYAQYVGDTIGETFGGTGTIDIAQVKLEIGDIATPFVPLQTGEEKAICMRYYQLGGATPQGSSGADFNSYVTSGYYYATLVKFKVSMRNQPTLVLSNIYNQNFPSSSSVIEALTEGFIEERQANGTGQGRYVSSYTADAEYYY